MAPDKPSMAFRFLDLNEDCQRMIIRQLLLEKEAKVMTLERKWPSQYFLKPRRPEANNRFGMVCKSIRALFEDEAHRLRVLELRSEGWEEDLEKSIKLWSKWLDLDKVRFLRLILRFEDGFASPVFWTNNEARSNRMKKCLVTAAKFTHGLPNLRDLELVVVTEIALKRDTAHLFKRFLFEQLIILLGDSRRLAAVHICHAKTTDGSVKRIKKSTRRKTAGRWIKDKRLCYRASNTRPHERRCFEAEVENVGLGVNWQLPDPWQRLTVPTEVM